jgi:hypothetical protein
MRTFFTILFLIASFYLTAQTLTFSVAPANPTGTYDPDTGITVVSSMTIRHTGVACSYFITFAPGSSGVFTNRTAKNGTNVLNYQIYDNITNKNILEDLTGSPGTANVLSGSFGAGTLTQIFSFTSYIAPGQLPIPAAYTDAIRMDIYIGTIASHGASVRNRTFTETLTVPALLDISIVPTGNIFNVSSVSLPFNFGTLSTGENQGCDFLIRSNGINTVTVTSTNGQIMKNGNVGDTSSIPYTFKFNSTTYALPKATAIKVVTSQPKTVVTGARYPILVTIGTIGWVSQATYSETLTFTATAN